MHHRKKEFKMDYLSRNNIPFLYSSNKKIELWDLMKQNTPSVKTYRFDSMIEEHGQKV